MEVQNIHRITSLCLSWNHILNLYIMEVLNIPKMEYNVRNTQVEDITFHLFVHLFHLHVCDNCGMELAEDCRNPWPFPQVAERASNP